MTVKKFEHPTRFDTEHRHQFEAKSPSGPHVVVSGSLRPIDIIGTNDDTYEEYEVNMVVGPWWRDVQTCVPTVTVNGFQQQDWDEVDEAGWIVHDLKWDTVGGPTGPNVNHERIRLKFILRVKGERSSVTAISYYFIARGRRLSVGGLFNPDP